MSAVLIAMLFFGDAHPGLVYFGAVAIGFLFATLPLDLLACELQQRRSRISAREDRRGYFVYLRSFREKQLETVTHSGGGANPLPNAFVVDDILKELTRSVSALGTLFVIGGGSGSSIASCSAAILLRAREDTWRLLFRRVVRGARAIFVTPGATPGIVEELQELSHHQLSHKVVIVMPPKTGRDSRDRSWNSVASTLAHYGYQLPAFMDSGMLYVMGTDLAPSRTVPYVIEDQRKIDQAVSILVADLAEQESTCEVIGELEAIEGGRFSPRLILREWRYRLERLRRSVRSLLSRR
jgi:hypothetical protein